MVESQTTIVAVVVSVYFSSRFRRNVDSRGVAGKCKSAGRSVFDYDIEIRKRWRDGVASA